MEFRVTNAADIGSIMDIIRQAQEYLKKQSIDQWQNNYPSPETIHEDIRKGYGYVLLEGDKIIGTVAVVFDGDKNYDVIDGEWLGNGQYAAIHRIAVQAERKGSGLASVILENIEKMCQIKGIHSIRVDTHEKNLSMQKFLNRNGFQTCGIIYLEDGAKRLAFEKTLQPF
jgi:GNAT superfamily N-acetyltransferase